MWSYTSRGRLTHLLQRLLDEFTSEEVKKEYAPEAEMFKDAIKYGFAKIDDESLEKAEEIIKEEVGEW